MRRAAQTKLEEVNGACCSSQSCDGWVNDKSFKCTVGCAAVLVPFVEHCKWAVDAVFDIFETDRTRDGKVSAH